MIIPVRYLRKVETIHYKYKKTLKFRERQKTLKTQQIVSEVTARIDINSIYSLCIYNFTKKGLILAQDEQLAARLAHASQEKMLPVVFLVADSE